MLKSLAKRLRCRVLPRHAAVAPCFHYFSRQLRPQVGPQQRPDHQTSRELDHASRV